MSLLTICQDAASDIGLRQPAAIVGSNDLTAQILFRLANQEGRELARYHDWQNITNQRTFVSLAQQIQTGALGADYDRMIYNPEVWNRSLHLRYYGPTSQRVWERLQSGIGVGIIGYWRILGNQLNIFPIPVAGQTIAFETISKNFCQSATATPQALFMADTDTANLPEDLITLGVIWRFCKNKGFARYAEDLSTYEREREKAASRDRGTGRIHPEGERSTDWPPFPIWSGTINT